VSALRRWSLLLALLVVLVGGLVHVLSLRLGTGDVFPVYSTHRGDPLGAMLLHDSLARVPGLRVERFYEPLAKLPAKGERRLIVLLGMSPYRWAALSDESLNALDAAVREGARIAVVFGATQGLDHDVLLPEQWVPPAPPLGVRPTPAGKKESDKKSSDEAGEKPVKEEAKGKQAKPGKPEDKQDDEDEEEREPSVDNGEARRKRGTDSLDRIRQFWGVELRGRPIMDKDRGAVLADEGKAGLFPASLPWRSQSYLRFSKGTPWSVQYTRGSSPVLAEFRHGKGSLVLATDAHFLSNEALQDQRGAELVAWLVGDCSTVLFSERHLGVTKQKGIAQLARRYGLMPAALLLVLAGLLYVWKQGVRFIPPVAEAGTLPLEFHPTAGLEALLRRAVPRHKLFSTCLEEWRRQARPADQARVQALDDRVGARAYNAALRALRRNPGPDNTPRPGDAPR